MQAIFFYLTYPFVFILASFPFWLLYRVSDLLYHILTFSGYRSEVVLTNLRNSFPDKSDAQIVMLKNSYYRYLCDLFLETLKTLRMTEREARERCAFQNPEWLDQLYKEGKSFIIVMGHYGNWEWAGPGFTLNTNFQLVVIYRPLSNKYFERMLSGMRTKFGTRIAKETDTLREMVANRKKITATALIADQTASPLNAYWTTFLNQDTPVYVGPEKLAKKFNYPVVYMNVKRLKRGYYEVIPELLFAHPQETADNEILEGFMNRLESEIKIDPSIWLWSHKRWKHKRISA
jgi:KDO2-lipid IV(A) lauroyltransferase